MRIKNFTNWFKVLAVPICFGLIFQIFSISRGQQIDRLNRQIRGMREKIEQTYKAFGGEKNLKDELIISQAEFLKLRSSFPNEQNTSEIIRLFSEEAKRHGILVTSIKPEQFQTYRDYKGETLRLLESECRYLPLRIQGQARFKELGEFLNSLSGDFTFLTTIEELKLEKDKNIEPELRFESSINIYLLSL